MSEVGDRLRAVIPKDRGEQKSLAYRASIRPETLNKILTGATDKPEFETIAKIARALGVSLDALYDQELPAPAAAFAKNLVSGSDRRHLREFADWVLKRFGDEGSEIPSPVTTPQTVEEKLETATTLMGAGTVVRIPERTLPRWTPEFPIEPNEFNDAGATDYPLDLHGREPEELDEAGVPDIGSMPLLNSKEVRTSKVKVVNVRDDSVAPFNAGWKLGIDVTQQNPALIEDGEVAVAYRKDHGSFVGRLYHEPDRTILLTDRGEEINLADQWMFIGPVTQAWITKIAKQPRTRKKKGGIS